MIFREEKHFRPDSGDKTDAPGSEPPDCFLSMLYVTENAAAVLYHPLSAVCKPAWSPTVMKQCPQFRSQGRSLMGEGGRREQAKPMNVLQSAVINHEILLPLPYNCINLD